MSTPSEAGPSDPIIPIFGTGVPLRRSVFADQHVFPASLADWTDDDHANIRPPSYTALQGPSAYRHPPHEDCPNNLSCLPNTNERPEHSFPVIIRCAILGSPKKRLTLTQIYSAIEEKFPFFRTAGQAWKNSIRHNLSLENMFDRVPRPLQEPGKGSYWTVDMQASAGYKRLRKRKSQGKPQRKGLTAPLDIPPRTAEQLAEAERGRLRAVALWTTGKVPEELGSDYSSPSPEADSERQNAAGDHQPVVNVWSPNHSLQEQSDLAAQSIDPSAGVPESPLQDDDIRAENQRLRTQCQTFQREDDRLRSQIATLESQLEEAHGEMARIKGLLQETQISQEDHRREVVRRQVAEQIAEEQTVKARAAERKLEAVEKECREPFVVPALYQAYLKFLEHPPCDAAG